jgi:hypothetical protein
MNTHLYPDISRKMSPTIPYLKPPVIEFMEFVDPNSNKINNINGNYNGRMKGSNSQRSLIPPFNIHSYSPLLIPRAMYKNTENEMEGSDSAPFDHLFESRESASTIYNVENGAYSYLSGSKMQLGFFFFPFFLILNIMGIFDN